MRILDLFSGIGGFSLGLHRASETFQTVAFCEMDPFCTQILNKHWPDVPVYPDIRELTYERLKEDGVVADPMCNGFNSSEQGIVSPGKRPTTPGQDALQTGGYSSSRNGKSNENKKGEPGEPAERTIDVVCGGFPCQPFSQAGKRRGKDDDRDLWPEMFRIIKECQPRWVVGENVAGFVNMELSRTVSNLESEGYEVRTFVLGACAVQAPHQRQRCWIIGRKRDMADSEIEGGQRGSTGKPRVDPQCEETVFGRGGARDVENSGGTRAGVTLGTTSDQGRGTGEGRAESIRQGHGKAGTNRTATTSQDVADSGNKGLQGGKREGSARKKRSPNGHITQCNQDVANSECKRPIPREHEERPRHQEGIFEGSSQDVADSISQRGCGQETGGEDAENVRQPSGGERARARDTQRGMGYLADGLSARLLDIGSIWHIEPDIPRVTTGEKNRVKKLKALGNSVVPQIPEIIGRLIMEVEREIQSEGIHQDQE